MSVTVPQSFNLAQYCLAENAQRHHLKIGLTVVGDDHVQRWSYAQLDLKVRQLAAGFKSLNLNRYNDDKRAGFSVRCIKD